MKCLLAAAVLILFAPIVSGCQTTSPETASPTPAPADTQTTVKNEPAEVQQAAVGTVEGSDANTQTIPSTPSAGTSTDAELIFLDFAGFDEDLSREMAGARSLIAVDVPAAFSLNEVPGRLDRWFSKVKDAGGAVKAREKPAEDERLSRGIVGVLIDIAVSAYKAQEAEELLRPAENYDAIIEYDKETGKADKVLFYRR